MLQAMLQAMLLAMLQAMLQGKDLPVIDQSVHRSRANGGVEPAVNAALASFAILSTCRNALQYFLYLLQVAHA
jgi:hypothetical protein